MTLAHLSFLISLTVLCCQYKAARTFAVSNDSITVSVKASGEAYNFSEPVFGVVLLFPFYTWLADFMHKILFYYL